MNEQKKEPPSSQVSLARIAWSLKELVDELRKMNGMPSQMNTPRQQKDLFNEDPPF